MEPGCAPRLMRWGASDEEVSGPYPGAEIVPHGERGTTMAVTINAPRTGCGRGWSNWVGTAAVGTPGTISTTPVGQVHEKSTLTGKTSPLAPVDAWTVAALEPNRLLGLHGLSDLRGRPLDPKQSRPSAYTEGLWGFLLTPLPDGRPVWSSAVTKPSALDGLRRSARSSVSPSCGPCRRGCWWYSNAMSSG